MITQLVVDASRGTVVLHDLNMDSGSAIALRDVGPTVPMGIVDPTFIVIGPPARNVVANHHARTTQPY